MYARYGDQGKSPCGSGESSPNSVLTAVPQGELVEEVLCQAVCWGPHLAQVVEMVPQLFHRLDLLEQEVTLQEVAQMGIRLVGGQLVQIEQALVDVHLQLERTLHGLQAALPVVAVWLLDVVKADAASALVLQLHQPLGVLPLLARLLQEQLEEVLQGHVGPVEVTGHRQVHVGGVELQADLAVDGGLAVGVVVLEHLRGLRGRHGWRREGEGDLKVFPERVLKAPLGELWLSGSSGSRPKWRHTKLGVSVILRRWGRSVLRYVTLRCVTSRHIVSRYVTLYYFTVGGVAGRGSSVVFWVGSGLG